MLSSSGNGHLKLTPVGHKFRTTNIVEISPLQVLSFFIRILNLESGQHPEHPYSTPQLLGNKGWEKHPLLAWHFEATPNIEKQIYSRRHPIFLTNKSQHVCERSLDERDHLYFQTMENSQ